MNEMPSLAALGEPCDNFANCLDPEFGASNGDPRADDETPFQCATYSFCPGKYVAIAYDDGTEFSETSAYKIQMPWKHPKERIQYSEHGDSLKSRIINVSINLSGDRGSTALKVLCYKSEGRWFDPSWCHWNLSLT